MGCGLRTLIRVRNATLAVNKKISHAAGNMALKCLFLLVFLPLAACLRWGPSGLLVGFVLGSTIVVIMVSQRVPKEAGRRESLEKPLIAPSPPPLSKSHSDLETLRIQTPVGQIEARNGPPSLPPQIVVDPKPSPRQQNTGIGETQEALRKSLASWLEAGVKSFTAAPSPPPVDRFSRRNETVSATRPPTVKKLQWVPSSSYVDVKGRQIPGMVYISDKPAGWGGEPSAICRSLQIDTSPDGIEELPYYPNFESLSHSQRGFYLDWLARERRDNAPENLPTGYLFLFFYGIERRILVDKDLDPALWFEVFELLRIYGITRKSRSIASYFGDFLHYTSYVSGAEGYANVCQKLLDMQGKRLSETALTLALANHFRRSTAIGWSLAHLVAMNLDDSRRSVVTERTGDAFRSMFRNRFETAFPEGMPLKASKRDSTVRYQTGNASLSPNYSSSGRTYELKVPGVMGLKSQFKGLSGIWNQCIEDLSGYSRAVNRLSTASSVTNLDMLKAHMAMPVELRKDHSHPLTEVFRQALEVCPKKGDIHFVPVSALAGLISIEERTALTQKQSEDVTDLVTSLGYTLAPHPEILNLPLVWSQEVALAPTPSGETHTPQLGGLLRLLYLGVLVASADGVVDESELQIFHRSCGITDDFGKTQIAATEAVLVRDTQVAAKQLQKIAKSVPTADRPAVFKLLIHIACSDDVLSSDENRLLRKIAKAFQLPEDALDDVLSEDSAFQTVTVTQGRAQTGGEAIPKSSQPTAPAFSLDMDRIAALTAETAEVVSILSKALAEESHEDAEPLLEKVAVEAARTAVLPEWAETIDSRYQQALLSILSTKPDEPVDVHSIAVSHHLMQDDLIDGINAWSDESLGDFLIEIRDDGQVFISHELIPSP